jgi:hypothetical protein
MSWFVARASRLIVFSSYTVFDIRNNRLKLLFGRMPGSVPAVVAAVVAIVLVITAVVLATILIALTVVLTSIGAAARA